MKIQNRYWDKMSQFKFEILLYNEHLSRYISINRAIIIILAVFSSGAVASWAIWNDIGFVWALLIALSQVLSIINEFLPYKKRIEEIPQLTHKLTIIYNEMEKDWFMVESGELDNESINKLLYNYIEKWNIAQSDFFNTDTLPNSKLINNKAGKLKEEYFKCFFEGGEEDEPETITNT